MSSDDLDRTELRWAEEQLNRRWEAGFDALDRVEQETIAIYWLDAETSNGSLDQYFHNSSGDLALLAESGLERLGCTEVLAAFRAALAVFGDVYPVDRETRFAKLTELVGPDVPDEVVDDFLSAESEVIVDARPQAYDVALLDLARRYR